MLLVIAAQQQNNQLLNLYFAGGLDAYELLQKFWEHESSFVMQGKLETKALEMAADNWKQPR